MSKLLLCACAVLFGGVLLRPIVLAGPAAGGNATPVLVELFTSEGCSSCPPADRLLAQLDKSQPFAGVDLIVLSEHVDYWNQLGWSDPFSSAAYSERQREYAARMGGEVYTPEAVVDGARGMVGSDEKELREAIRHAGSKAKEPLLVSASRRGDDVTIALKSGAVKGSLYVVLARDSAESQVLRGENSGRRLGHVAVVYAIREVAKLDGKSGVERELTLKVKEGTRVVAYVSAGGRVVAAGHARI